MSTTMCKLISGVLLCSGLALFGGDGDKMEISQTCLDCHDGEIGHVQQTVHQMRFDVGCQDCHVDYQSHLDDEEQLPSTPSGSEGQAVCASCHDGMAQPNWGTNAHAQADVYCTDCHNAHDIDLARAPLLADNQEDMCLSCHSDQRVAFSKPFTHSLGEGTMSCASCHNPHGGRGENSLVAKHTGEGPCVQCHAEKRGPFVFEHVNGIAGDCMDCHQPHGSANPFQLNRSNVRQTCLECHTALPRTTFGSQPPASHDLRSPRFQNCTVCHSAVHGSSRSPALLK